MLRLNLVMHNEISRTSKMSILKNAIDSIQLGIEDYELIAKNPKRLTSCTRNLFSGILLLFKYHLAELSDEDSDEVLIKQKITPKFINGEITFVGEGKKTVDVQGIQDRFKSLDIIVDWKQLDKIQAYRNNIEHYFSNEHPKTIESILAHSFNIINAFTRNYLEKEPSDLFGTEYWNKLLDVREVYTAEKQDCAVQLGRNIYMSAKQEELLNNSVCLNCGSDLIKPVETGVDIKETDYICLSCQNIMSYTTVINSAVPEDQNRNYGYHHYKDGGEDPYTVCPECCEATYSMEEGFCLHCEEKAHHVCSRCETALSPEEVTWSEGLCGYCQYQWEKIMEE